MNPIRFGQLTIQVSGLFVAASHVGVSPAKAQKNKVKSLVGLFVAVTLWSVPALAQERNEVGLVIGGIVTPSQTLSPGASVIGSGGAVLPNRDIALT